MVKERDEQMIEAEKKERAEKKRRRKEWWDRLAARAARITSVIAVLFLIGGSIAGGYGYFDGWFCKWGVGYVCPCSGEECGEKPPSQPVDDPCDPESSAFDVGKCIFDDGEEDTSSQTEDELAELDLSKVITNVPGETDSYWNIFSGKEERPADFGASCDGEVGNLHHCIKVLYATPRNLEFASDGPRFGKNMEQGWTHLGYGDVSVPLPCSDLGSKACDPTWKFAPTSSQGQIEIENIDKARPLSDVDRREAVSVVLRNLSASQKSSRAFEREQFVSDLRTAVHRSDGRIFLYVHGYNQTFDAAMKTAALMTTDLNFDPNDPLKITRPEAVSYPLG